MPKKKSDVFRQTPPLFDFQCAAPKENSLYCDRLRDALALLCGGRVPPVQYIKDWFDPKLDSFDLQDWAACNTVLHWAQGIVVIEAAVALADQPEEGREHLHKGESHKSK